MALHGDVDLAVADQVRDALEKQVATGKSVLVDCTGIAFIDSRGLSALICARRAANQASVGFQLLGVSEPMRRAMRAAGIDDLFALV
ncbi:MAG: STAS domain-containing protein [Catenulispora sp.]|nr:STAS domain-containing protein [Catenulispora sp.]